jgi:2-polyprenyl-3-methyl-5-hydroxy-6-metoxy-1,4-benzoquinol methylase
MSEAIKNVVSPANPPWHTAWPADELEHVAACPVCGSVVRETLHENLVDNVFFVAPGHWTLYHCTQCKNAYLDPRPDRASIGKAYGTYYTHSAGETRTRSRTPGALQRLKLRLSNGYVNQRYGTRREPASASGRWLGRLLPRQRQRLDVEFRYLPRPHAGQKLLDIGCGNGDFLLSAREAGWRVVGIDPDPKAIAVATQRGLDVSVGSIESLTGRSGCFDAITLSHVLEHVHEPQHVVQAIHRLLKPGGVIYIDTPNIESRGAQYWGKNWRGLETPRHLVLFSLEGLVGLLKAGGFDSLQIKRRTAVRKFVYLSSLRMQQGKSPNGREPAKLPLTLRLRLKYSFTRLEQEEFLTLVAWKKDA